MRRRKIERVKRAETTGFKVEQHRGTLATNATILSLAKKARGSSAVSTNRVCSDERDRMNECRNSIPKSVGSACILEPICDRYK